MIKKYLALYLIFLICPAIAALNVPLTVKEALYPGGTTGVARTAEPVTVGIPLPDSANISSTSVLGLSGASAGQFMIEGKWPSGNIKWLKIRAIVPSVAAGGSSTLTLTDGGSGNFGGSNLATDNGATITVSTGAATFTIKKANFNVLDQVVVGGKTVVASGTSQGLVVLGPDPTAAYPGNVTCSPTAGGTACTTVYASSNDAASTCTIEENGPAMSVVKCDASLMDGASHTYMKVTVREYFTQGKASVKETVSLRNAEYGTSNTFASAAKGYQGFELRLAANVSGTTNYSIATHTSTPNTGTLSAASDSVYIYQAESTMMKTGSWCGYIGCVVPSPLNGYAIVKNGSAVTTGTNAQYPQGWADISDTTGAGVEIGQYQFAAYGNKSLEFRSGGKDVRVGIWASENNTTSTSSTTANKPYYIAWPQYNINDVYLNFHASASSSLANDFLSQQHYLIARAPIAHYNSTGALLYPLLDPAEEDAYYASVVSSASPSISTPPNQDLGISDVYNWLLDINRFHYWSAGGISNQSEFRLSWLMNFIRRGYSGGYLGAAHFYKLVAELAFPRSDGFDWKDMPGSQKQYWDFPTATSANASLAMNNPIESDGGHMYWWGMPTYYFMSGDETIKDAILDGPKDAFLDTTSTNNWLTAGKAAAPRSVGNILSGGARLASFLADIGDSSASTVLSRTANIWALQVKPDLCVSGYPSGCTALTTGCNAGGGQQGTSKVRGVTYQFSEQIVQNGCPGYTGSASYCSSGSNNDRAFVPFMNGIMIRGLNELRQVYGPSWSDSTSLFDTAYGITQANFGEMFVDNGSASWSGNGFRYKSALDHANSCNTGSGGAPNDYYFMVQNPNAWWPLFLQLAKYEGNTNVSVWQRRFNQEMQQVIAGGSTIKDELWQNDIAQVIYAILHPSGLNLTTQTITNFTDNGGGSYTLTWSVPPGAQSYRIKWGTKKIVDWIGFDAANNVFIGDPVNTMNWFAATDAANIPAPSGTTQSITISTGTNGLTAANFMIKAYATGSGGVGGAPSPSDTTPPTVSVTAPAAGATVNGSVTLSATANDNVGVTSVQFKVDGANVGSALTGSGPTFTLAWDTKSASNGSHAISATASDAAGNVGTSSAVTVTVNNTVAAPVISSVSAGSLTSSTATITWITDISADSQVSYGTSVSYGLSSTAGAMTTTHTLTLSGLSGSTTYHFQVLSRNSQGTQSSSSDFTFTTLPAQVSGAGTAVPVGTWTPLTPHGPPAQLLGFDKSVYVPDIGAHCAWGSYHQVLSSETQQAVVCFNYSENRWYILQNNGVWGNEHTGQAGHSDGVWTYSTDDKVIVKMSDFAGSSTAAQQWLLRWYWFDPLGLTGRDKAFSPRPLPGTYVVPPAMVYDSYNKKLVLFPDSNGVVQTCVMSTNLCTRPTTSGPSPGNRGAHSMVYNPDNHKVYLFGGNDGTSHNDIYTFDAATNTWTLLTTTCSGADCVGANPPARQAAGMAYSTQDKIFLMAGGIATTFGSGTAFTDTWIFDPAKLSWTELSPGSRYTNNNTNTTFDRVTYDTANNVFVLLAMESVYADGTFNSFGAHPWVFPYSQAQNYATVTKNYAPAGGSQNKLTPSGASQSWAYDQAIAVSGNMVYAGAVESGAPFDTTNCGSNHHPYIKSSPNNGTWTNLGANCAAIDSEISQNNDASQLRLAVVGGTLWEAHEKWNRSGSLPSQAYAKYWDGSAWQGGPVGCFTAACGSNMTQKPVAMLGVGSVPTLALVEWQSSTAWMPEGNVYVAQWNGSAWNKLGSGRLNVNGNGTRAIYVAMATDGTNPAACWTEEVNADRITTTTTPQLQCKSWNGSSWVRFGSSSLNQNASAWAGAVSMTYAGGSYYISWTERTTSGNNKLYACKWNGSSCSLLGGGPINMDANAGWATHPSLATDGTNVYLAWEEQAAIGQHVLGYLKKWNGSAWSQVGGALVADPANGSVEGLTLAVVQGSPTAIWGELSYGNLRQTYLKQWNGTNWNDLGSSGGQPTVVSKCDLNSDGKVDQSDVQMAIDQALGVSPCTSADLQGIGKCSVVGVQRVINASMGSVCMTGN